jgi:hypothetical protein
MADYISYPPARILKVFECIVLTLKVVLCYDDIRGDRICREHFPDIE